MPGGTEGLLATSRKQLQRAVTSAARTIAQEIVAAFRPIDRVECNKVDRMCLAGNDFIAVQRTNNDSALPEQAANISESMEKIEKMARVTGLEPATSGVTGRHSNRLSYTRASLSKHWQIWPGYDKWRE